MKTPKIIKKLIEKHYNQNNLYCGKIVLVENINGERVPRVIKNFAIFHSTDTTPIITPTMFTHINSNRLFRKYCASSTTHEYCAYEPTPFMQYFNQKLKHCNIAPDVLLSKQLIKKLEFFENELIYHKQENLNNK